MLANLKPLKFPLASFKRRAYLHFAHFGVSNAIFLNLPNFAWMRKKKPRVARLLSI